MLDILKRRKQVPGLTAVCLEEDGIAICRVVRGPERREELRRESGPERRPVVTLGRFHPYAREMDLAETLMRLGRVYQLESANCTTLLDQKDYKLLLTKAPEVAEEELASALRWQINDLLDCPAEDIALELFDLPGERAPGQAREIYVATTRRDVIARRVEIFTDARVNLQVIDIPELAQRNIARLLPEDAQGVAVLWLHRHGGLITLSRQGNLYLSRHIKVGMEALGAGDEGAQALDTVTLEIQRSLDYYESHHHLQPVQQLVLAPVEGEGEAICQRLGGQLGISSRYLDLEQILQIKTEMPENWQQRLYLAIGAALRGGHGT